MPSVSPTFSSTLLFALSALAGDLSAQTTSLELGKAIEGDLSTGQTHTYSIALGANQYFRAVVTQPLSAVLIELVTPDGKMALEVDTRDFPSGPARIVWVTEAAGEYRMSMSVPGRQTDSSHYEIKLDELHAAGAEDHKRVEAERLFTQGLSEARKYSYDQALSSYTAALGLYREIKDREREADMLTAAGSANTDLSQYEKAISYHEEALSIRREIKDRRGEGATLNNLGVAYRNLSQSQKAINYLQQALAIRREVRDRQGEGGTLANLGDAHVSLSQIDKATGYLEQALLIDREVKDRRGEGTAIEYLGRTFLALSQYEKAIDKFEHALAIQREVQDHSGEGVTLNSLGNAYRSLSQFDRAIAYYEQSLAIRHEVKNRRGEGFILGNLGNVYSDLSQYEKAIGHYEQAVAIAREIKNLQGEGLALNGMGTSYASMSEYGKAIGYYEQALVIARQVRDNSSEGMLLNNLGNAYNDLGQHAKAIGYFEQALAIAREIKDRYSEDLALNNLGWAAINLSQYRKAVGYYKQALAIERVIKDRQGEAITIDNLGDLSNGLGQYQEAIRYFKQALAIEREIKDRRQEGMTLSHLGVSARSTGAYFAAVRYQRQAIAILREVKARTEEAIALTEMMSDWKAMGQGRQAIFYGKQAVNLYQAMRSDIRGLNQESRTSFLKGNEKPYHALGDLLISQGRLGEAEQVLGLLKEDEYFQYIRRDPSEASLLKRRADLTPEEAEYEKRYSELGGRLMAIGAERGEFLAMKTRTPEQEQRLDKLEQDLVTGNQAFERFMGELTRAFRAKPEMSGRVRVLQEMQGIMADLRKLPAGTVAIFTLVSDNKFLAILRTTDAQKAYQYPIKAVDLKLKVAAFRQVLQDPKRDPRPLAQELYKIMVGGMAADLRQAKAQTLMWSLDGALRYVPLAALYDGKQYLIEQYRVSVMTLASNTRLKDPPTADWKAAGFGATSTLPSVSSELAGIITTKPGDGGALSGEIKLDGQFTQQAMRQALRRGYPVVHIASHFSFQPGDNAQSFLLLGDGGRFTMAELKTSANLFEGVQLLTLSACNTGVGDGKEVEGFGALAQQQGATAVIASLWPVADESTSLLMPEFYRIRESSPGITKLEALRQAQLKLLRGVVHPASDSTVDRSLVHEPAAALAPSFTRDPKAPYAHPYYWAPFFLMGNWL